MVEYETDGTTESGKYVGWFDIDRFDYQIKELFEKGEGFYSWSGLKYFLFEYELYLQEERKGKEQLIWEDFNKKKKEESIEKIYPQNPKEGEWEAMSSYNEVEKGYLLNTLGNLLLLKLNSEIEVAQYENWTPVELLERGINMLKFLEKRWNIKFKDYDKLLKLDFLNKKSEDKQN